MRKFVSRQARFIIAGMALVIAFALSIEFNNRGWQWDLENGGSALAFPDKSKSSYNLAGAEILNKVLLQLKEKYVDPTRIDPNRMLVYALNDVQRTVPEVVITFDRDIDDSPTNATVEVNGKSRTFEIGRLESLWEMSFRIKDIFLFLQANLEESDDLKFSDLEYAAINGILNTLDPHSMLLSPEIYKDMQTQTGGKFGGLGIVISVRDAFLTVVSPMDDTPASRAGIKTGDRIMQINDESTVNMTVNEAASRLRGDPGTAVSIWVTRKGWVEPKRIEMTRAIINIESVESHLLANKMGYVKIKSFQSNTQTDLKKHLEALNAKSGGINGLVLDLRNNPGGLLDQAIKVSDTFLDDGTIVSTVGFGNKLRDENKATRRGTEPKYPIIMLVDPGSASASEIVAGALKNHDRAIVVGDTTFGKGSVQVIYELGDGSALKLTIAQYLTPGEVSIQSVGIIPDIKIQPVTIDAKGVDMFASANISREADLESHLDHKSVRRGDKPASIVRYFDDSPRSRDDDEDTGKFEEDFAIRFAQKLLRAADKTWQRPELLKAVEPTLRQVSDEELNGMTTELAKLGVDWSAGQDNEAAKFTVELRTDKASDVTHAGDKLKLTATVTNTGTSPIHRLRAVTSTDNDLLDDREFIFGKVEVGESRSWTCEVDVPRYATTRDDIVQFNFGAMSADVTQSGSLIVHTRGQERPHFAFSYSIDDSAGNGDGILQPGENVRLHLSIKNDGNGDAGKTTTFLRNLSESALFLNEGRVEVEGLKHGEVTDAEFNFDVKSVPEDGKMRVEVEIFEEVFKEFTREKLSLTAEAKPSQTVEKLAGTFEPSARAQVFVTDSPQSNAFAWVDAGTRVRALGKTDAMVRVQLDKNTYGWMKASEGALKTGAAGPAMARHERIVLRTPPVIAWKEQTAITDKAVYQLNGLANDDNAIKDYYIFVQFKEGRRIQTTKVAYKKGGSDKLAIDTDVPLRKGMNRIRVVVRDKDDMNVTDTVYVYRK